MSSAGRLSRIFCQDGNFRVSILVIRVKKLHCKIRQKNEADPAFKVLPCSLSVKYSWTALWLKGWGLRSPNYLWVPYIVNFWLQFLPCKEGITVQGLDIITVIFPGNSAQYLTERHNESTVCACPSGLLVSDIGKSNYNEAESYQSQLQVINYQK